MTQQDVRQNREDGKSTGAKRPLLLRRAQYALRRAAQRYVRGLDTAAGADRENAVRRRGETLRLLRLAGEGFLHMGIAFLFSRTAAAWGTFPFGLAYLCCAGRGVWFAFAGVLLGALTPQVPTLPYVLAALCAMSVRYTVGRYLLWEQSLDAPEAEAPDKAVRGKKNKGMLLLAYLFPSGMFCENILLRCGIAGLAASVAAIGVGVSGGQDLSFLAVYLFLFAACGAFTYLFSGTMDGITAGQRGELGYLSLLYVLTLSLAGITVGGISLQTLFAFFAALYVSKSGGLLRGGVTGIFVGMACDMIYAPLFALAGLISGALWRLGAAAAVIGALLCGGGYAVYIGHFSALRGVVPDLIIAAALFYPLCVWERLPAPKWFAGSDAQSGMADGIAAKMLSKQQTDMVEKLDTLSGVLSKLSETFYSLSLRAQRPSLPSVRESCEEVMEHWCNRCSNYRQCWEGRQSERERDIFRISSLLCEEGRLEEGDFPPELYRKCRYVKDMTAALNRQVRSLFAGSAAVDKIGVFARDYENMARMLTAAIEENTRAYRRDSVLGAKMQRTMERMDFRVRDFAVLGDRKKNIVATGVDMHALRLGTQDLREALEKLAGMRYATPLFDMKNDQLTMTVNSVPQYTVQWGSAQNKKENEPVGGDVVNVFQNKEDYFYALLSDGMGSGREASVTAQICAMFTEQMLMAGNSKAVTLEMLNHFLRSRQTECTTTVDLLQLDLLNGQASFVKSGAAPSYLVRGEKVYRIASATPPVGILEQVSARQTGFAVQEGDMIVLVSDGVAADHEQGAWLCQLLVLEPATDAQVMADRIVSRAASRGDGKADDLSAVVLRVGKAS